MPLTDTQIRNARPRSTPYRLADGYGLYLEVRPTGAKLWRYRYRINGRENLFAVGEYPGLRLAEARIMRADARELVKQGIHPSHHRRQRRVASQAENANTFEAVAREWIAKKASQWSATYQRKVQSFLEANAFPTLGALPIRSIRAADLLNVVRRIEDRGAASVALLIRQWASAIFDYAIATLRAETNPALTLRGAIQRPITEHSRALTRSEISNLTQALDAYKGTPTTIIAPAPFAVDIRAN